MRALAIAACLLAACDAVPPLVFEEAGAPDGGGNGEGGCPDNVPSYATLCCGSIPCFGATCCSVCGAKCTVGDLCCATVGNVVCRKNGTSCP